MSTLPVRSPLPNKVPSTRSAPAMTASSAAATAGAAIIVRMHAQDERVAPIDVPQEPFDLIGIDIGRGHLDGGR